MTIVKVEPQGNWAVMTTECDGCGIRVTHVFLIGSVQELDCVCGGSSYPLGWEVMTELRYAPEPN